MTLFRFTGLHGRTLLSAAVYPHPRGRCLFIWYGSRVASWVLNARGSK